MNKQVYTGDGTSPLEKEPEAFCQAVAHGAQQQAAYCQARGILPSPSVRVRAHRWSKYYAKRIEFLRAEMADAAAEAENGLDDVDASSQNITALQREITSALQEASVLARKHGHGALSNRIKASLVRHIGRVQRAEKRNDGAAPAPATDAQTDAMIARILEAFSDE